MDSSASTIAPMPARRHHHGLALSLLPLLVACTAMSTAASTPSQSLHETAWVLAALPGRAEALPTGPKPTLRFEDGRALGNDGCNRYTGAYTVDGPKLSLLPRGASTMRACVGPQQEIANHFKDALARTQGWRLEATNTLVLVDATGAAVARLSAQATGLAGTAWWVLAMHNGQQAVVSVVSVIGGLAASSDQRLAVEFSADGRISGFGGCNRFSGTYREPARAAVEIGTLASTRRACADDALSQQETALLNALQTARSVRREADRLELRRADGAIAVQLMLVTTPP